MSNSYKLPYGMQDFLGVESYNKGIIVDKLEKIYTRRGYHLIETPSIEYLSLFNSGFGAVGDDELFTLTDSDGNLLALRSDMTVPISRVVATKLNDIQTPYRICYTANSFARKGSYLMTREYTQSGIELIGSASILADAEVLTLAIQSLLELGVEDFQVDIGHVGYLQGIIDELNVSEDMKKQIIEEINKKDKLALAMTLQKAGLQKDKIELFIEIPLLFGSLDILNEARQLTSNKESLKALSQLERIYSILDKKGLAKYISFDLGYITAMKYYSGIVFKGMTRHCGSPILSGGRYDDLCRSFNKKLPATGFAIGIKNILIALDRTNNLQQMSPYDIALGYSEDCEELALDYIAKEQSKGKVVFNTFINSIKELKDKKSCYNAVKTVFISSKEVVTLD